jgi:hypothetical protein
MTINDFMERLSQPTILSAAELDEAAIELRLDERALCDLVAREMGEGYLAGRYSWEFGDATMNSLFSTAHGDADCGFSGFAWDVFSAFDEGEYQHPDSPELDGEPRTRKMLEAVFGPQST